MFRFGIEQGLGLPVGQHLVFKAVVGGEELQRKYTPTTRKDQTDYFEVPIKVYRKCEQYPEGGKFTRYLESLAVGDSIQVAGPRGNLRYLGQGTFDLAGSELSSQRLTFIAGGTGITPCYQVLQYILEEEAAKLDLTLIYANNTEEDILLRAQLDAYAHSGRLKVHYVLESPPLEWPHSAGLLSPALLSQYVAADSLVFHCGPRMMNVALKTHLTGLGFEGARVHKF
jgi:ferredoxin-NADP reductase